MVSFYSFRLFAPKLSVGKMQRQLELCASVTLNAVFKDTMSNFPTIKWCTSVCCPGLTNLCSAS